MEKGINTHNTANHAQVPILTDISSVFVAGFIINDKGLPACLPVIYAPLYDPLIDLIMLTLFSAPHARFSDSSCDNAIPHDDNEITIDFKFNGLETVIL